MKQKEKERTTDEIVLAHKRRTALVLYLAILFVAALAFVAISLFSQNQKMNTKNQELRDNSESVLDRAEKLQDRNRELQEENKKLDEQIKALENVSAEYDILFEEFQTLQQKNQELQTQVEEQQTTLTEQKQALQDKDAAADLLLQAQAAFAAADTEAFRATMEALKPLQEQLSTEGKALYQTLLETLQPSEE